MVLWTAVKELVETQSCVVLWGGVEGGTGGCGTRVSGFNLASQGCRLSAQNAVAGVLLVFVYCASISMEIVLLTELIQ
jgi:hypothetical protein